MPSTLIGNVHKKIDKNRYSYKLNRLVGDVQRTLIGKEEKLKIYQLHVKKKLILLILDSLVNHAKVTIMQNTA